MMSSAVYEHKSCDICQSPWVTFSALAVQGQEGEVSVKRENVALLPGAEGCLRLNDHLRAYFITTKLLKLPKQEFAKLITTGNQRPSSSSSSFVPRRVNDRRKHENEENDGDGGNGEKGDHLLYSTICSRCENIVNEAMDLHVKMMELQGKVDKLGETLFGIKEIADKAKRKEKEGKEEGVHLRSLWNTRTPDDNGEGTAREMLGLSLACIGKAPFPTRKKRAKKLISPRKLRSRTEKPSTLKMKQIKPEPHGNVEKNRSPTFQFQKLMTESSDVDVQCDNSILDGNGTDESCLELAKNLQISHGNNNSVGSGGSGEDEDLQERDDEQEMDYILDNDEDDRDYKPDDDKSESDEDVGDEDPHYFTSNNRTKKADLEQTVESSSEEEDDEVEVTRDDGKVIGRGSVTLDQLQTRCSSVLGDILAEYQCKDCNKIFSNRSSLKSHTIKIHGYEIHYTCPKCPELKFSKRTDYTQHRNQVHGHVCDKCGKKFSGVHRLYHHFESVHKMKLTYSCPVCKKGFKKRGLLISHRKEHKVSQEILEKLPQRQPQNKEEEEWAQIPCDECGKRFLSGDRLDVHLLQHHEHQVPKEERLLGRRKCYFCWRNFYLEQRRSVHMKMAHPENIAKLLELHLPCEKCNSNSNGDGQTQITFTSCLELLGHFETEHKDDHIHTCSKCGYPFLDEELLKKHELAHLRRDFEKEMQQEVAKDTYQFKCWFCWEVFPDEKARQKHLANSTRHKRIKIEFPCDLETCEENINLKKPFSSVTELNEHLTSCHGDNGEIHHCSWCSWGFTSKDMLTIHKLNHVPRIKSQFKCPLCEHITTKLPALRNHYNSAHELNLKLFKCSQCRQGFRIPGALYKHVIAEHTDPSTVFACDQCVKTFRTMKSLKSHQETIHVDHNCRECGQSFGNMSALYRHKKQVHEKGTQHLCSLCGKVCLNRATLRLHMVHHGEAKFECPICHVRKKTQGNLRQHIKHAHNPKKLERPPPKFPCLECDKGFNRKDSLDDHVRVEHTNDTWRVWTCDKCGKRFKRSGCLADHLEGKGCPAKLDVP